MLSTSSTSGTSMSAADEEKRAAIMELKSKFDGNNNKLKQVSFPCPPDVLLIN